MKDVLIIAHFSDEPDHQGNNRFNYIAGLLQEMCTVELVTSRFSHGKKMQRSSVNHGDFHGYVTTLIREPSYKKNVSLKRFYSHYVMSRNLKKYLAGRKKPDVIYCAVPSLDVASVAAQYAGRHCVRFIIDVQDLWPEAFQMVFPSPLLGNVIFSSLRRKAESIYREADEIIAVSQTYADRALQVNGKCQNGHWIFLGTELERFDRYKEDRPPEKPSEEVWLAYIGTLGHSYDLKTVLDALILLKQQSIENIKFVVMGDGPLRRHFEEYAKANAVFCHFTGVLAYSEMVRLLTVCDIAVNPIRRGAAQSIINKVGDYAAAGLPVINTQECPEYRKLVSKYNIGLNCKNSDPLDLAEKLLMLYEDETLRALMGKNNRKLAEEKFDRKHTYGEIVHVILKKGGI